MIPFNKQPFIKVLILLVLTSILSVSKAQVLPKGVNLISNYNQLKGYYPSLVIRDVNNAIWLGISIWSGPPGNRSSNGLYRMGLGQQWVNVYPFGIFTDALNSGTNTIFSAYDGIHTYDGTNISKDSSITNNTCLAIYKSELWVGSMGNGLFRKSNDKFIQVPIIISGKTYDSIYSIKAHGTDLWIGTTSGLIKYDGMNFMHFDLPIKPTSVKFGVLNQNAVADIAIDKKNRLWVLTRNQIDSLECLFFLENNKFTSARNQYAGDCYLKELIPHKALCFDINKEGNLIIGMLWGVLEFAENLKAITIEPNPNWSKGQSYPSAIYCDPNGNYISTVFTGTISGIYSFDPKVYNIHDLEEQKSIKLNAIDINEIKASTANDGTMFNGMDGLNGFAGKPRFDIPNLGCAKPMFSSGLWLGGMDASNNNLHMAAQTYKQNGSDFLPGPIDLVTHKYDTVASAPYNRIWKVDRKEIEMFKLSFNKPGYIIPRDILEWPAHGTGNFAKNLAPFVDADGNGIYEPTKGDYPKIKGDQMLWWIFNDLCLHDETTGKPLEFEIHGSLYAYYNKELTSGDSNSLVNRTIIFDYKFINRSPRKYKEVYAGVFNDVDLGNYADDMVGCDTVQNVGFGYNGDNFDETSRGFGKNPPMIFCKFLNRKMTNFIANASTGNPGYPINYYGYLRGDTQFKSLGFVNQGYPCNNPYNKAHNTPSDRRFVMSSRIGTLEKDSSFNLEFAYIFLHDPNIDFLKDACDLPQNRLNMVQNWYNNSNFPSKPYKDLHTSPISKSDIGLKVYPNPSYGTITISSNLPSKSIGKISIHDNAGREILNVDIEANNQNLSTTIDTKTLPSGTYFIKVLSNQGIYQKRFVKI